MLEALPQKEPHRRALTLWCPRMTHSMAQIWRKGTSQTRNCRGCWHMLPSSWFWICHATFCKCMVSPTPADWLVQWLSVPWYIRNGNQIPTFSCRYLPFQWPKVTAQKNSGSTCPCVHTNPQGPSSSFVSTPWLFSHEMNWNRTHSHGNHGKHSNSSSVLSKERQISNALAPPRSLAAPSMNSKRVICPSPLSFRCQCSNISNVANKWCQISYRPLQFQSSSGLMILLRNKLKE